jgi:adenylate cyclase
MQVAARTSSFVFKGRNEDASKIARLLHVRNLLEGSVQRSADKVRIEVQLIDATNGFTLWSDRYDKQVADVFQIQSEVAESVAQTLRVKLLPELKERIDRRPTENLEAYDLYLRGRYYNAQFSEDGWTKAVDFFRRAIEKDPNFGLAYAELANAYAGASSFTMAPRDAYHEMKAAIDRALAIDETIAGAHGALAFALYSYEWNWPGAERELNRALELEPSKAMVNANYCEFLDRMGRYDEALRQGERALELNPLDVQTLLTVGWAYRDSGNEERAVDYFNHVIEMEPDNPFGYMQRGMVRTMQHNFLAALPDLEKGAALGHMPVVEAWLASTYALAGRPSDARKVLGQLKEQSSQRFVDPALFCGIYFALGDKDQGFQSMESAYEERSYFMVGLKSPMWDTIPTIRQDPRFQAIYKKVGLPP